MLQAAEKAARAVTQNGDAALPGRKSMAADVAAGEAAKTQKRAQKKARKDGVADTGKSASLYGHQDRHVILLRPHVSVDRV